MPEINYKSLNKHLDEGKSKAFAPVYLIYGEELLCKNALNALVDKIIPASTRSLNYEPMDGREANIFDVIERVNTFSLLSGEKIVALCDSRIFDSKADEKGLVDKAKDAHDQNDLPKAAKYLVSLLGLLNLTLDDIDRVNGRDALKLDVDKLDDDAQWLDRIVGYCREKGVSIGSGSDDAGALQRAVEKGFPPENHLIITMDGVDKRRSLYKIILEKGVIVDCSVPKGERKAAKIAQEDTLRDRMKTILARHDKTMAADAYSAMIEMTGFDLHTISNNVLKLISYVGGRKQITVHDVETALHRTKKDPIYELTNAVSDRSVEKALFFLDSLLSSGHHPLQILAAVVNQMRRLLVVKGFSEYAGGGVWRTGTSYPRFSRHTMPEIEKYDDLLLNRLDEWNRRTANAEPNEAGSDTSRKKKKKSGKSASDLLVARDPKNSYPVYQTLLKSEKFTKDDLYGALECLKKSDRLLKSSSQHPKLVLEKAILDICGFKEKSAR
jgi:DNA polymerase-3 subunit delta